MKRFNYSLLFSALALSTLGASAATYEVVPVDSAVGARHSYGIGLNNTGDIVGVSRDHFNFPIDLDNLNMAAVELDLASAKASNPGVYDDISIEDIQNGIISAKALAFLKTFLVARNSEITMQKVGDQSTFLNTGGNSTELSLFDQYNDTLGSMSRSTVDLVNAINDNGVAVGYGSDMYFQATYTPEPTDTVPDPVGYSIWMKNFLEGKGVVIKGDQKVVVDSPETQYGGASYLTDISDSNYVVGYAAVGISESGQNLVDDGCLDFTEAAAIYKCVNAARNLVQSSSQTFYTMRAYRWKLDDNLQVVEATDLGLLFTPKDTDTRNHISVATGVNEQGHVVGYSSGFKSQSDYENDSATRIMATYYDGSTQKQFVDNDKYRASRSLDINDSNIVVGFAQRLINGAFTKQMFIYDGDSDTTTYPVGFFASSASVAYAVNNNNKVVGTAEVDNAVGTTRRQRGFIYDIASDEITDLNKLTSCDNPYTIAEARDINDDGVIVGTALLNVPKLDAKGEETVDSNGNTVMEEVARAVKLVPIPGGVVDDCNSATETPTYDRKGASFGWLSLLLLLPIVTIRRLVR